MIELLIMRHAKSDWSTGDIDFARPLNDRGQRNANQMAAWLASQDLVPDHVVSSTAARARATALAVVHGCDIDRSNLQLEDDLYLADVHTLLQTLMRQTARRVLICAHNPGLDDLVDALASDRPPLSVTGKLMTTAAIAHFEFTGGWTDLEPGMGTLRSLTRPRELGY